MGLGREDGNADPRIYMAAERTFLAWIRTGVVLLAFGFVVARFGIFLRQVALLLQFHVCVRRRSAALARWCSYGSAAGKPVGVPPRS